MANIRNYTTEDYDQVKEVLLETELYNLEIDTKERFEEKISEFQSSILVAEDEKVVGVVFITDDATNVLLTRLGILPDYQGKGIGTELVKKAEQMLKDRKVPISVAFAESGNEELKQWYKEKGYEEKGDYTMMWKDLN